MIILTVNCHDICSSLAGPCWSHIISLQCPAEGGCSGRGTRTGALAARTGGGEWRTGYATGSTGVCLRACVPAWRENGDSVLYTATLISDAAATLCCPGRGRSSRRRSSRHMWQPHALKCACGSRIRSTRRIHSSKDNATARPLLRWAAWLSLLTLHVQPQLPKQSAHLTTMY